MKVIERDGTPTAEDGIGRVVVLLDASGSMGEHRNSVITTFNEYVQKILAANPRVTLYTFDSAGIVQIFRDRFANAVHKLTPDDYVPNLMTPLYDAIGTVLNRHPGNFVQFVIHTDGLENASSEYTLNQLNAMIVARNSAGCQFTWLGEGPDGWNAVKKFADVGQKFMFSNVSRGATMGAVAATSVSYTSTNTKTKYEDIKMDEK